MTPTERIAALEGALRGLLVDNDHWIYDAADRARKPDEYGDEPGALCEVIDHARTVLNAGTDPSVIDGRRVQQTPWQKRHGLDLPGRLQENSSPEDARCWLETVDGDHVAEFNVAKVGPMESVMLAQELARLWNRNVGGPPC